MNEITFSILQIVVSVCMIIVMRYVIPYLKAKLQSVIDESLWNAIMREVKSVEQTITGSKMGAIKKEEVIQRIYGWANKHGIEITDEQISQLIEAAVFIMKNEGN